MCFCHVLLSSFTVICSSAELCNRSRGTVCHCDGVLVCVCINGLLYVFTACVNSSVNVLQYVPKSDLYQIVLQAFFVFLCAYKCYECYSPV